QERVDARLLVTPARSDAVLGRAQDARARLEQVVEGEQIEPTALVDRLEVLGVRVRAELPLALAHPARDAADEASTRPRVPLERRPGQVVRLLPVRGA